VAVVDKRGHRLISTGHRKARPAILIMPKFWLCNVNGSAVLLKANSCY